jgi:hypothetical protein
MKFRTVEQMVLAGEKEWRTIPGIGLGISSKVWREIRGQQTE